MKITREFCGQKIEIELTGMELWDAYSEERKTLQKQDIRDTLQEMYSEDDPDSNYVTTGVNVGDVRKVVNDDEWLGKAAERFEKALGRHDEYWDCYWQTAKYVCKELLKEAM